jgi:hypothetical protein
MRLHLRTHGCEVQREMGVLNHPYRFLVHAMIRYFSSRLSPLSAFPQPGTVMRECPFFQTCIDKFFAPLQITWQDLCLPAVLTAAESDRVKTTKLEVARLLQRADASLLTWSTRHLLAEAHRLNLIEDAPGLWARLSPVPPKYLQRPLAKHAVHFRRKHMGHTAQAVPTCIFCQRLPFTGPHLLYCPAARGHCPLSEVLSALSQCELERAWLLDDTTPETIMDHVLKRMHLLQQAAAQLRAYIPRPSFNSDSTLTHNRHFLRYDAPPPPL